MKVMEMMEAMRVRVKERWARSAWRLASACITHITSITFITPLTALQNW
jgi:hypothetical protein